jgi:hypothetical protein
MLGRPSWVRRNSSLDSGRLSAANIRISGQLLEARRCWKRCSNCAGSKAFQRKETVVEAERKVDAIDVKPCVEEVQHDSMDFSFGEFLILDCRS